MQGKRNTSQRYATRYLPSHPRAHTSGVVYEHILVWESLHGPIPPGYEVHHRNENKKDNRIENLELLTVSQHRRLHGAGRVYPNRPRMNRWSQAHDACMDCGTTERRHAARGLCKRCLERRHAAENPGPYRLRGSTNPSAKLTEDDVRAILRQLAEGMSGPSLAREYGVSNQLIYRIKHGKKWAHITLPSS